MSEFCGTTVARHGRVEAIVWREGAKDSGKRVLCYGYNHESVGFRMRRWLHKMAKEPVGPRRERLLRQAGL